MEMGAGYQVIIAFGVFLLTGGNAHNCPFEPKCRCFYYFNNIQTDCSNLGLRRSPYFWSNVTRINLSHNRLTQLPYRTMLPDNVIHLDLSYNLIKKFRNDSFKGLRQLSVLKLNSNKFRMTENLSRNLFSDLINIKKIDLSNNNELTFRIMPVLTYGLQNSTISTISLNKIHDTFGLSTEVKIKDIEYLKHTNLTEVHVSSNRIEALEEGTVAHIPKTLRKISIADNRLTYGQYVLELETLKSLEWINASLQHFSHAPNKKINNVICRHEKKDNHLTNIFHFSHACIQKASELPKLLKVYKKRKRTHFTRYLQKSFQSSTNEVYILPVPPNMKKIFYNESGARYEIPAIHCKKNHVEELYLQGNAFFSWKGPIRGAEKLRILNLSNNFCSSVSKSFFNFFSNLSELYLSDNFLGSSLQLDTKGQILENLTNLIRLDLRGNKISNLPKQVFKDLQNLKYLNLADNALSAVGFHLFNLKQLQFLDLSGNQIQFLSDTNMEDIDRQTDKVSLTLNLFRNPIACTCKTLSFLQWMVKSQETKRISFESFENYSCTASSQVDQFVFSKIKENIDKLKKECNSYTYLIITLSFIILLFFVILLCGLLYRYRWKLRYFYYMTKSRYHGYKAVRSDSQSDFKYDAFVSYADDDFPFVQKMMLELEENNGIRLCIHHRDFVPGYDICENIITAVNKSKKTIAILSPNFIKSSWCMYELHIAKMEDIYSRENEGVLLLVFYDVVPVDKIPLGIMDLIIQRSYIEFPNDEHGDSVFWRRVCKSIHDEF